MFPNKGSCGYIRKRKLIQAGILLGIILVSVGLFLCGYLATKTTKNLLTVVSVLGVLPGAKALVTLLLFLPYKSLPENEYRKLSEAARGTGSLYADLVMTPCGRVLHLDALYLSGTEAAALLLSANAKKEQQTIDDISESVKKRALSLHIHVFHTTEELVQRIQSLAEKGEPSLEAADEFIQVVSV